MFQRDVSIIPNLLTYRFFAMKLLFIICVFWAPILIEGVPNNFEVWLQPRGIGDLPFFGWFYGSSTEETHENDASNLPNQQINESSAEDIHEEYVPNSLHQKNDESDSDKLESENVDQLMIKSDPADEAGTNRRHGYMKNILNELGQETNEPEKWKSKDVNYHVTDDKIKVIPVDKVEPNEKPEPIENLLQNLKHEVNETNDEQKKNIATLLADLNKTMKETSTNLAKVFINKAWKVFDIGALGTTRRTRNLEESMSLLAPLYALLGLVSQLLGGMQHLGGNNLLLGNLYGGNNAQTGLLELLFPFLSSSQNGVNQKVLGGIAGLPGGISGLSGGQNRNSSKNVLVICLDDKNKKEADRLLHGKTPDAILLRIKEFLEKNSLSEVEQFYIILKLHELFDHLSGKNDETALKLLKLIILISEDPRFQELFKKIKLKKEPEFDDIWKLFKHKPKLNNKYLTILRNLPRGKMTKLKAHPSRDCFIIGPDDQKIEAVSSGDDNESDSDDEEPRSKRRKNSDLENYIMKLTSRDTKSKKDYYICCLDDEDEVKAKRILDGETNDETIDNIKKKIERDDLSPEYKWYIILRLYNMLKDIEKDDKKDAKDKKDANDKDKKDKEDKDKKDKEDKEKIIKLIIVIGENPKFEPFVKEIKSKDDPRFNEIWKLLKNEPRETKIEDKSPEKISKDQKEVPKISTDIVVIPPKEEKVIKEDDVKPKKEAEIVAKVEPIPPPPPQIPQWITNKSLPEILTLDQGTWERNYEPILRHIETKIKDPALDEDSRWNIVDLLDRLYLGKFVTDPLLSQVKSKADGLVDLVKPDPKYNETFDQIKKKNPEQVTKRVFNLFGKEYKEPESNFYSQTRIYRYPYSSDYSAAQGPTDDNEKAILPLIYKIDTLITIFENSTSDVNVGPYIAAIKKHKWDSAQLILGNNQKDFDNLENGFLAKIRSDSGYNLILGMLRELKNHIIANDYSANGKIYTKGEERRKIQDFINLQVAQGKLIKLE